MIICTQRRYLLYIYIFIYIHVLARAQEDACDSTA